MHALMPFLILYLQKCPYAIIILGLPVSCGIPSCPSPFVLVLSLVFFFFFLADARSTKQHNRKCSKRGGRGKGEGNDRTVEAAH